LIESLFIQDSREGGTKGRRKGCWVENINETMTKQLARNGRPWKWSAFWGISSGDN